MQSSTLPVIVILALFYLPYAAFGSKSSHLCSDDFLHLEAYVGMNERQSTSCRKLTTLQAQFAWNFYRTSHNQTQVNILIGTKMITDAGWLAWGVNPDLPQMVGTRAIIAIKPPNGSSPFVNTYNITKDTKLYCSIQPSDIGLRVQNKTAQHITGTGFFTISATLILPESYNISRLNHVWQVGYVAEGFEPMVHSKTLQNFDSREILDLNTGQCQNIGHNRRRLRKIHGILNIIGWGTLMPIGVIIARYFRLYPFKLESWWFTFHYSCQALGYILGSFGWGLGLLLGHESKYYTFYTHRVLGICIFGFATLQVTQMLAFRLKPTKDDEYRKHWNVYHHFLGYSLLVMIPVNIYQGIQILKPDNTTWKWAYNGILVLLAMVVLALEVYTWTKFLYQRKGQARQKTGQGSGTSPQADQTQQKTDNKGSATSPQTDQDTSKQPISGS
ncbi:PREDICTED: cytochrome b561 and DOMON domain-containing protein At4g12980 isoform X1 [Theobroma cacao]|uniref:Cytochrome b561 and DOMON domain-containing protein At4g12980 isoform X1 n=1 Tax=Theobroma cacao TaxID=3641 RepID=A0AB32UX18_THECC|nr:PREDICTED: cytochrome b561 and DOMON domain-containing protein At4g12980 isoform X1 [Theobroma cacao]